MSTCALSWPISCSQMLNGRAEAGSAQTGRTLSGLLKGPSVRQALQRDTSLANVNFRLSHKSGDLTTDTARSACVILTNPD